jgi:hypothetical protein
MSTDPSRAAITIGDGHVTYEWAARKRPFIHPLATPAGHVVTRNAPDDHPWHHGLWFTIKFVNDENFWEEYDAYGVLRHTAEPEVSTEGNRTTVVGELTWIRPDRETVVIREQRSFTHVPLDAATYAVDLVTTLTPEVDVVLDRTEFTTWGGYGGLAFRGRGDWHDTRLVLSDGTEHDRLEGVPGSWCALDGPLGGGGADDPVVGIAMLAAPHSPRLPVPFYASTRNATYGEEGWSNFMNAAFLWDGPLSVAAGEPLTFTYRVLVGDGRFDAVRVGAAYDAWLAEPTIGSAT